MRSPALVNATTLGVTRRPSEFSRTSGSPPSMTAMQEFVVPKSMPKTLAIKNLSFGRRDTRGRRVFSYAGASRVKWGAIAGFAERIGGNVETAIDRELCQT